jgi:hypothetical protein
MRSIHPITETDGSLALEGAGYVSDETPITMAPQPLAVEPDPTSLASAAKAALWVLMTPRRVFAAAGASTWRVALAPVVAAALVRSAALVMLGVLARTSAIDFVAHGIASLLSPAIFIAAAAGVLLATWAIARTPRRMATAWSLASLAAMPLALKALAQTVAMAVTGHTLHAVGIFGFFAPDAPAILRAILAPLDVFSLWAIALVIVATIVSARQPRVAE